MQDVGLLPDVDAVCLELGFFKNIPNRRIVKLTIRAKCISVLLYPLKTQSHVGSQLRDPWGRQQFVFVRLFSYVAGMIYIAVHVVMCLT